MEKAVNFNTSKLWLKSLEGFQR